MMQKLNRALIYLTMSLLLVLLIFTAAVQSSRPGQRDVPAQVLPYAARLSAVVKTSMTDESPEEQTEETEGVEERQPPEDALSAFDHDFHHNLKKYVCPGWCL